MSQHLSFIVPPSQQKSESGQRSVANRLLELLKPEDGWLNGEGKSLSKSGVRQFISFFEKYFSSALPTPHLFPTPTGNLQAEWVINDFDVTVDVNLADQSAFYHTSSDQNEEIDEMQLNLAFPPGWQQLVTKLTALSKG